MNLLEILNMDSSRFTADVAAEIVGNDPVLFREVLDICFEQPYPVSMRAARVVQLCCEKDPELIYPHLEESFRKMLSSGVEGVGRGFLKIYAENIDLRKFNDPGILISLCFDWLASIEQPIAVKVYAMEILRKYCIIEPDLSHELAISLDPLLYDGSPAIRSRARKVLKDISGR